MKGLIVKAQLVPTDPYTVRKSLFFTGRRLLTWEKERDRFPIFTGEKGLKTMRNIPIEALFS